MDQDLEHLRLLSIFHYVVAGLTALFACFPIFHLAFGLVMFFAPGSLESNNHPPPGELRFIGLFFAAFAGTFILAGWTLAVFILLAGRNLARHRRYTFCLMVAGIMCMLMPFGTVLGVFTIVVLVRPPVKELFDNQVGQVPRT